MSPTATFLFLSAAIVAFVIGIVLVGVPKLRNSTTWLFVGLILWVIPAWYTALQAM